MRVSNFPSSHLHLDFSESQCGGHFATNDPLGCSFQIRHDLLALGFEVFHLAVVFVQSPTNRPLQRFGTHLLGKVINNGCPRDFRHHHLFLRVSFANPTLHPQGEINVIVSRRNAIIDQIAYLPCATFDQS